MQHWYQIIPKNTGLSIYAWIIFCILPFFFIFRTENIMIIIFGIIAIGLFFEAYRLSFISQGWPVYVAISVEMLLSIVMTVLIGYVYFALFLAFYIGNIQLKIRFVVMYTIHLVTTLAAVTVGFFTQSSIFMTQLPFIVISVVGVILLPLTIHSRNKREKLEMQLQEANEKLSHMVVLEERQRIARDLHDTLGQKLSLIGLKSDLAAKIMPSAPDNAKNEILDINQTARTALKEVRELVSEMKGTRLKDEFPHIEQILQAADIDFDVEGDPELANTPALTENVVSMCLKEAVTNVVKHSQATRCCMVIEQSSNELTMTLTDNGIGVSDNHDTFKKNGLLGMEERLAFINGSLDVTSSHGTIVTIQVPNGVRQSKEGELL